MKPTIINADYMISPEEIPEVDDMTEIHFSRFGVNDVPGMNPNFINKDAKKIFCHVNEPTTSRWVETPNDIIKHHKQYDKIVSSNPEVIKNCSNAIFMAYGTTWLNKSKHHSDSFGHFTEQLGTLPKNHSISMICNSLHGKSGYNLRHAIFSYRDNIQIAKNFYSSTRFPIDGLNLLPEDDKIHLFNSMYSIAIESSSEINYFTEKLIDCLITKTIPVYWGCPNIHEFFDTSYWIKIEDVFAFDFSENYYNDNLNKILNNFEQAKPYCENILQRILKVTQ